MVDSSTISVKINNTSRLQKWRIECDLMWMKNIEYWIILEIYKAWNEKYYACREHECKNICLMWMK